MTRREITRRLRQAGIEEAQEESLRLFCHYSGRDRAHALAAREEDCTAPALEAAVQRRERREPLAYILGEVDFYAERYRVTPQVLIPRPDTEVLVDWAIAHLPPRAHFADYGTGSGCIAISILAHRPDCTARALDISPQALEIAQENARRNGVDGRMTFAIEDMLEAPVCSEKYDAILSNPPYIAARTMEGLAPELRYEPRTALTDEGDGVRFYRALLTQRTGMLRPGGCFALEIGYDQGDVLRQLAHAAGGVCEILRDYGGRDRVACVHFS